MFWGIIFLTIGIIALLQQFGYLPSDLDLFWPIIFIGLGLSVIFGRKKAGCCGWWIDGKKKK